MSETSEIDDSVVSSSLSEEKQESDEEEQIEIPESGKFSWVNTNYYYLFHR